jgi:hypothetical protein
MLDGKLIHTLGEDDKHLARLVRAQANFAENVPFAVIVTGLPEMLGAFAHRAASVWHFTVDRARIARLSNLPRQRTGLVRCDGLHDHRFCHRDFVADDPLPRDRPLNPEIALLADGRNALFSYFPYASRIFAWIFAMPDIQRS